VLVLDLFPDVTYFRSYRLVSILFRPSQVLLTKSLTRVHDFLKELGRRWWRLGLRLAMDQDKVIINGKHPIDPVHYIYIVD
jgi:hypothetical protein